jgi:hypothetical protein
VNEKLQKILDDLFNERVDSRHSEVICQRKEGTGKWLLESPEFTDWVRGDSGSALLWAHGIGSFILCVLSRKSELTCTLKLGLGKHF